MVSYMMFFLLRYFLFSSIVSTLLIKCTYFIIKTYNETEIFCIHLLFYLFKSELWKITKLYPVLNSKNIIKQYV